MKTRALLPVTHALLSLLLAPQAALHAAESTFQSLHLAIGLAPSAPAFSVFAVDSLGQGKLDRNPVLPVTNAIAGLELAAQTYQLRGKPIWRITFNEKVLTLRSDYAAGAEAPPFTLVFNQKANHATLLGLMKPGERQMSLPCVLHLPDMGTLRITGNARDARLDYDARRFVQPPLVRVAFPAATAKQRRIEYRLEVVAIHPKLEGIEKNPLYDGSDGFQFYENGGATGCWAYYTVKALHQLGRVEDARRIFHPMLSGYAAGKFQGFDPKSGRSLDWRDWQGGGHGYEGLLVDNYHALLAVLEDVKAKRP